MESKASKKELIVLWVVAFLFLMEMLDGSILNTSFPQIAFALHTHPISLKVALTSYMLALAVLIPISGWLADRFGVRNILIFAIGLFLVGSIGCGLSQNLHMLVVFRIIQGLGGSFMAPIGRLVVLRVFGRKRLLYAMMRVITLGLIGSTIGPMVGGALTTYLSWRYIFFVNVVFCVLPLILIVTVFPRLREPLTRPFDGLGFIFFGTGFGVLLYVADVAAEPFPDMFLKLMCLVLALMLISFYVVRARLISFPMLDLNVFKALVFRRVMFSNMVFRLSFTAYPFAIPLMLQVTYGYTALQSGFVTLFLAVGSLVNRPFMALFIGRFGYKKMILLGCFLAFICSVWMVFISYDVSNYLVAIWCLCYGFAISTLFASANTTAFADVPNEMRSMATSVFGTMQQTAMCFGIAIAALFLEFLIGKQDLSDFIPGHYFTDVYILLSVFALIGVGLFVRAVMAMQERG